MSLSLIMKLTHIISMSISSLYWQVLPDAAAVAQEARRRILTAADQAIEKKGCFKLVLAGGSTPKMTYQLLRESQSDWRHWHIYYGDERCLPVDESERNSVMAWQAWLAHVAIPATQIHPIPAELGAVAGASRYAQVIDAILPFDMVLLGMGEDGHTASLFPGQTMIETESVHAVFNAPKPPPERVSLSKKTLAETNELLFLITGSSKQAAVTAWREGKGQDLPVSQIPFKKTAVVLLDQAANGVF